VPLEQFHLLPGDTPQHENVLAPGDIIAAIEVPAAAWARRSHYRKVRDRASFEFALAAAAVALDIDGGTIRQARIALGGVGTKPWRARDAEAALAGAPADKARFAAAAARALDGARPLEQNAFKVELAQRTLVRALATVSEGA
jgi:xanthine dehydrogenase YagS FAD-binding subunit